MITDNSHHTGIRLKWRPRALWAAPFAALIILMALAAACAGGSSSPGVANVDSSSDPSNGSSSSNDSDGQSMLAYSQCMREQGISNYPDPNPGGGIDINADELGIEPDAPQFKAADEACKHLLPPPSEGERPDRETMLRYSQCMRDQGISSFPDPNPDGTIDIEGGAPGSEFDQNSPQYQAADEACKQYLPDGVSVRPRTDESGAGE
jgi:hypothetical protein